MDGSNNDPRETINAAATAIAAADNRLPQASAQKKRWGSFWRSCFGSRKHKQRIGHAVLSPETTAPGTTAPSAEIPAQQPSIVFPFIAPPSSPASFLQSEPPSCIQSPTVSFSLKSISASMYSPGPASMFTIGPYAHETQLVSPPVLSTFTTEPSTAPFTPPPESRQLTTPSSPEVPFARLSYQKYPLSQYEFQSYHLYPGSPVGQLISPGSGISNSGTSSPFPNGVIYTQQGSGTLTPDSIGPRSRDGFVLNRQYSDIEQRGNLFNKFRNSETVHDHRVSFEITAEDVVRCMAKEPSLAKALSAAVEIQGIGSETEQKYDDVADHEITDHRKHRLGTLDSIKEFNFDNTEVGNSGEVSVGPDLWANEKAHATEGVSSREWSFFPMIQSGVDGQ